MDNAFFMRKAIELAKLGIGFVNPNPLVGAVIVKDGEIVGEGYHVEYGQAHAEVNAIRDAQERLAVETFSDCVMYVTLEPCSHYGKTPPCSDLIIKKGFKKVYVGMLDPNPLVAGRGIKKLEDAGIEVVLGLLAEDIHVLNKVFLKYISERQPYVVMKTAMSLDGKIATRTGESKWISSEASRSRVHELRHELSAILVGVNTVIKDNPKLTCRLDKERVSNPIRVVLDSSLKIPMDSEILKVDKWTRTIIATTDKADENKVAALQTLGVEVVRCNMIEDRIDLNDLMKCLAEMKIDSVLVEGGGTVNEAFLKAGLVDEVMTFLAPKLIGGRTALTPVEGEGVALLSEAVELESLEVKMIGTDILIRGYVKKCSRE